MPWFTNKETGGVFNTDWIDEDNKKKDQQIADNKSEADKRSQEEAGNLHDRAKAFMQNKEFSKLGNLMASHRREFGLSESEDAHEAAYDIITGNRSLNNTTNEEGKQKTTISSEPGWDPKDNAKYAPSDEDVASPENYFADTDVRVNTSLSQWTKDADDKLESLGRGVASAVGNYMDNSSINNKLTNNKPLDLNDRRFIDSMDAFTNSGSVPKGTILYSGITSEESLNFWNSGDELKYQAYLSTSPDPVYAMGYGMNTGAVLQIECTRDTRLGKCYYEDSTGTEGVLGRNKSYKIVGESEGTIQGEKFKIIKVRI